MTEKENRRQPLASKAIEEEIAKAIAVEGFSEAGA